MGEAGLACKDPVATGGWPFEELVPIHCGEPPPPGRASTARIQFLEKLLWQQFGSCLE